MEKSALIILANGFEEVEALTPIDILRRAGVNVTIAGLSGTEVCGGHEIRVKADIPLSDVTGPFDALILPGGQPGTTNLLQSERVIQLVGESFTQGRICAAICAAPTVFDRAGILANKKFTCYPGEEKKIRQGVFVKQAVVQDGTVITSRGLGTAVPFGLQLVATLIGPQQAKALAARIVFQWTA